MYRLYLEVIIYKVHDEEALETWMQEILSSVNIGNACVTQNLKQHHKL